MWDLDLNGEISTLYQIGDFNGVDTFVRTGYKVYYLDGEQEMDDYIPMY